MSSITEHPTSIFSAPANSILIHANNAKGHWGAGVALAFKQKYPAAHRILQTHCNPPHLTKDKSALQQYQRSLLGTCFLISPQPTDIAAAVAPNPSPSSATNECRNHWIANLFTSHDYGARVAKPEEILAATGQAMRDLERQVGREGEGGTRVGEWWAVRINSGKFGVEWKRTLEVLEEGGWVVRVAVPETEGGGEGGKVEVGGGGGGKRGRGGKAGGERGRGRGKGTLDGWLK